MNHGIPDSHSRKENIVLSIVPKYACDSPAREASPSNLSECFSKSALDVTKAVVDTYGASFSTRISRSERQALYSFEKAGTSVDYTIYRLGAGISSLEIASMMVLREPVVNLTMAGRLVNHLLESHLLAFESKKEGMVFYAAHHDLLRRVKSEGLGLLGSLGVVPEEAAEYISVGNAGFYVYRSFKP